MRSVEQLWAETFRYAAEHSPYYREQFRRFTDVPALTELPTVDKRIVSERNLDFLCVPRERIVEIVTTSGTTGQPLLWMLTDSDLHRLGSNEALSFECASLTPQDTVLVAVAMDRCFIAGLAYWMGLRELGCATARVGLLPPPMCSKFCNASIPPSSSPCRPSSGSSRTRLGRAVSICSKAR
jgi:phenylacetate-CoA ligase